MAIPRLARPQQVLPSTSVRPSAGPAPQLQQQANQLSQQQLQHWHSQQMKAYQQRMLEQQMFAQQSFTSQPAAFTVAPQYDREELPASSTALPFSMPAPDTYHPQNVQEMLMQQLLYQQMYEAAVAQQQQQQQMKSTVSAGAINLMQHHASENSVQQAGIDSSQFRTLEADQLSAMRRASEGQVYTSSASCVVTNAEPVDSDSHTVASAQPLSTDAIPASAVTHTADNPPSQNQDETFKVPFPPDHVRCQIFDLHCNFEGYYSCWKYCLLNCHTWWYMLKVPQTEIRGLLC